MNYRRLGTSGLNLSIIGLGSWATIGEYINYKTTKEILKVAYDRGINYFDTAEVYGQGESERVLGQAFKDLAFSRDTFIVSSKLMWGTKSKIPNTWGLNRKHIIEGCNDSLKRLNLDYIDILLAHRFDKNTTIRETAEAFNYLICSGKILYWGTSEWEITQLDELLKVCEQYNLIPPIVEQPEYSLFVRNNVESNLSPFCEKSGMGITSWSPLAYGLLAGRYIESSADTGRLDKPEFKWLHNYILGENKNQKIEAIRQLYNLANEVELPCSTLALSWVLNNKHITTAIIGASSTEQLTENLYTIDNPKINKTIIDRVSSIFDKL